MARKIPPADFDNAIRDYLTGESSEVASARYGFSPPSLVKELKRRGLFRCAAERHALAGKNSADARMAESPLDSEAIVRRYISGESSNAIAKSLGCSRRAIDRRLTDAGVQTRTVAEGNQLRASQRTPDENRQIMEAAHAAQRGKPKPFADLCAAAKAREMSDAWLNSSTHVSDEERVMAGWLRDAGLRVIQQKAVGPYNVDIAAGSIAVEIHGGGWHNYGSHKSRAIERARYILDEGWTLVVVWRGTGGGHSSLTRASADYVAALAKVASADPSLRGQYRVIWGDGKVAPTSGTDLNELANKPTRR